MCWVTGEQTEGEATEHGGTRARMAPRGADPGRPGRRPSLRGSSRGGGECPAHTPGTGVGVRPVLAMWLGRRQQDALGQWGGAVVSS